MKSVGLTFLLLGFYTLTAALTLPEGINQNFCIRVSPIAFGVALLGLLLDWLLTRFLKKSPTPEAPKQAFEPSMLFFLFFPLAPMAQHFVRNWTEFPASVFMVSSACIVGLSLLLIIFIPFLIRKKLDLALSIPLGLSLLFLCFLMPTIAHENHWYFKGSLKILAPYFAGVFIFFSLLFSKGKPFLYLFSVLSFLICLGTALATGPEKTFVYSKKASAVTFPLEEKLKASSLKHKPDIYLLLYDAYVSNDIMLQYGIDNRAQENYLREKGFKIYPNVYTIEFTTLLTLASMLNMNYQTFDTRGVVSGESTVMRLLTGEGYQTYAALPPYFFGSFESKYDASFTEAARTSRFFSFLGAIGEGQFRFDFDQDEVKYHKGSEWKRDYIDSKYPSPKFFVNHTRPFHSQNSGECLPDETELFHKRLVAANTEMKADIEDIEKASKEAITVIFGDHGPYLTGDCYFLEDYPAEEITRLHLQDRLGAFMAIKWPEHLDYERYDDIQIIQDVFHVIMATLYGEEAILQHKIKTKSSDYLKGIYVEDGIIVGGADDGKPLFESPSIEGK